MPYLRFSQVMVLAAVFKLLVLPPAAQGAPVDLEQEGAIVGKLFRAFLDSTSASGDSDGWHPGDPAQPCQWPPVECNGEGRVTAITLPAAERKWPGVGRPEGKGSPEGSLSHEAYGLLLPELAQLQLLESLDLQDRSAPMLAGIPEEWSQLLSRA